MFPGSGDPGPQRRRGASSTEGATERAEPLWAAPLQLYDLGTNQAGEREIRELGIRHSNLGDAPRLGAAPKGKNISGIEFRVRKHGGPGRKGRCGGRWGAVTPSRGWIDPLPSSVPSDGRARAQPLLCPPQRRPGHELPRRGAGGVGGGAAGGGGHAGRAPHRPAAPQHRQVPLQEGGHLLHRHRGHPGRGLRLHRLRLRPGLLRGARPGPPQGCRGVQGCAAQLRLRRDGADLPGVLPEEEVTVALLGRVHPLGALDHQGERGEPGERAGAADLPREGGREALREDHQHRGGDEPPRVPAQDAHPVRGGQRLRHQPEGCAALPVQDLLPDHGLPGHLSHHHHAPAHQGHAGTVGLVSPRQGHHGPWHFWDSDSAWISSFTSRKPLGGAWLGLPCNLGVAAPWFVPWGFVHPGELAQWLQPG